ncbi:MAG TPA: hypothetical protein ENF44_05550, partial [Deltaproteobacteria bacterium]|nr:hypothetical protein [Deltaproteobacteria bacterium]
MKKVGVGICMLLLLVACAKKQVVTEAPPTPPPSQVREEGVQEGPSVAEETLKPVKYPGIQGEVMETPLLKDIHFDFDRYDLR